MIKYLISYYREDEKAVTLHNEVIDIMPIEWLACQNKIKGQLFRLIYSEIYDPPYENKKFVDKYIDERLAKPITIRVKE